MQRVTARLLLREFRASDVRAVERHHADPRYPRWYTASERAEWPARRLVGLFVRWSRERPRTRFQLAIVRRADGALIGNVGVRITSPADREAEFGCALDPEAWGRGHATEAARAILRFAFGRLRLHRVWCRVVADNRAAVRLAERLGFRLEGRLRRQRRIRGRWRDTLLYARVTR
jgi:RimJ/RimL family protein N-acetyltransferase